MEISHTESRSGLWFKFILFYLLSVGIIIYALSLFWPVNASSGMLSAARPALSAEDAAGYVANLQSLNGSYTHLKELDQEFAQQTNGTNEQLTDAEATVTKELDSLAVLARSLPDRKAALQLQNFVDAYRFALSDRSAMRVYKIAAIAPAKNTGGTPAAANTEALTQMQAEITARDKRIAELQNQNYSLEQRVKTAPGSTGGNPASQQAADALRATIAEQEKKIVSLTAVNNSLEKQNAAFSRDAGASKQSTDNSTAALRTQNATLERQVASLTAEVRLAQVDCSLTRADASQIISSSKQRKALLSDAIVTLNNLSGSGDAAVRKRVSEKMVKLNQVASTVRD